MIIQRIIWAVDADQEMDEKQRNVILALNVLARQSGLRAQIEPVYVVPAPYFVQSDIIPPTPVDLTDEALGALERKLKKVSIPGMLGPRVLFEPTFSNAHTTRILIQYAQDTNTDLIVVGTHARRRLARLFLGSFAESLILNSTLPVMTVNPGTQVAPKFSEILFPTDFEKESSLIFTSVLEYARGNGAHVTVFHQIASPFVKQRGEPLTPIEREYLEADRAYAEQRSRPFLAEAVSYGVSADLHLSVSAQAVSASIIQFARRHEVKLIAMSARSGRSFSLLTGSITRQVVRSAHAPVWVLRPQPNSEAATKAA